MSDRDESLPAVKELAEIIDDAMDTSVRAHGQIPNWRWDGPLNAADAVLRAGFRRTVTPEQVEAADRVFCEQMAEGFSTEYALRAAFKSVGRDSTGKYQWYIDECGCWRWSLYDPAEDGEQ